MHCGNLSIDILGWKLNLFFLMSLCSAHSNLCTFHLIDKPLNVDLQNFGAKTIFRLVFKYSANGLVKEIQIILRLFLVITMYCQASSSQFNQSLNLPHC